MSFGPVNLGPTNNQLPKCHGPSTTCVYTMVNIWTKLYVNATMIDKVLTLLHYVMGVVYNISTRIGYPFVPKKYTNMRMFDNHMAQTMYLLYV